MTTHGRVFRYSRDAVITVAIIAVVLLAARLAAPYAIQRYVNNKLDESPDYAGEVGDIDLSLIRGAYTIQDVRITKTEGNVPVPLFAASEVDLSILWSALWHGAVVGEAVVYDAQINIVDSKDKRKKQTGLGGHWLTIMDDLFPLRIDQTLIHNGQLHFRNYDAEPKVDIYLSEIEAAAHNLSSRQALTDSSLGRIEVKARAMNTSDLTVDTAFDPTTERPTFDMNLKLLGLPVETIDSFIRAYAPFDFEAGRIDIASEMAARNGALNGYVKPIIHDLVVFKWSEDIEKDHDNPIRALWEALVGAVAKLLQNQPQQQLASIIPLRGDLSKPDTSVIEVIGGILKNAFVEAFKPNLEKTVSLFIDDKTDPVALPEPLAEGTLGKVALKDDAGKAPSDQRKPATPDTEKESSEVKSTDKGATVTIKQ